MKIKEMSSKRLKQLALLTFCLYLGSEFNFNSEDVDENRRMLSISKIDQNCTIIPTKQLTSDDLPIFIASFPGSGARLSWQIVEALTGKPTGDEWNLNGLGKNVIAVKTHWPHPTHGNRIDWDDEIKRAFLLVRNPLDALPAFHDTIYSTIKNDGSVSFLLQIFQYNHSNLPLLKPFVHFLILENCINRIMAEMERFEFQSTIISMEHNSSILAREVQTRRSNHNSI